MKDKELNLLYFSPTHTSAKVAYAIAEGMGVSSFAEWDITYEKPDMLEDLGDSPVVVAVPVYGGRVAKTAVERLRQFKANQAPAVAVVLYGNRDYEDALRELCDLLSEQGFIPVAGGAFIGEHSYSRDEMPIADGRPDATDLERAHAFGEEIAAELDKINLENIPALQVKGNFPYKENKASTPQAPVVEADLCTQCEYCIGACPVEAISLSEESTWSDPSLCIKCCACVKECPEQARTFDTPYTKMLFENFSRRREPETFL